jgi:predicted RNA binding protein YcfA (HicA-like mRNA interferase family)
MTWAELTRRLRSAGFVGERIGRGSHRKFAHPITKKEVWVSIHTKKDVGRLAHRILKDAGLE